jgi:predicted nucleic acid-binding protein
VSEHIFADSSGFFAAFAGNDAHHRATVNALSAGFTLVTKRVVVFETISLITKRLSPFYARAWYQRLVKDAHVVVHEIELPVLRDAERFWLKHRDKTWDLIDCYSFSLMRHEKLTRAFTLDQHFRQAGFTTLPTP